MATSKDSTISATGRRKESVARVNLTPGTGKVQVNGRTFEDYFPTETVRSYIGQPLTLTETNAQFDIVAQVSGGGIMGQAGAMRHGLARALVHANEAWKPALKSGGFLTRDARMKERKKVGQPGARKRFQFSKR